jgi:PBP1b-binding outer membrane lipoprotein LpoB
MLAPIIGLTHIGASIQLIMKKYISILAGAALLAACEQKTETTNPPAESKTENNTTVVNPSPAKTEKTETNTTVNTATSPSSESSSTTTTTSSASPTP